MRQQRPRTWAATAVAIWIGVAATASRADAAVSVSFQITDPEIGAHFGATSTARQQQLAQAVTTLLNGDSELRFWSFASGTTFPQLQLRLQKRTKAWQYEVTLRAAATGAPIGLWNVPWQTEADVERIGGFPPVAQLATQIIDGFENQFLAPKRGELLTSLRFVPLGTAAHVDAARPVAILSLDWDRYQDLALSDFKILFRTQTGSLIVLATGAGNRMTYPSPPPAQGVAVQLRECEVGGQREAVAQHLATIRMGQPIAVFLTRFDPLGATLSAAGGGLPPPSVAPRD
jgi:hypothetical protein